MNKTLYAVTAAALAFAAPAARADVKVVQHVSIDNAQINAALASMSPDQKAQMEQLGFSKNMNSILYLKGGHVRIDFAQSSFVVDSTAHTITQINRLARTYSVRPYTSTPKAASNVGTVVRDTGQSKNILGHKAEHYTVRVASAGNSQSSIRADVWIAADLPTLPLSSLPGSPLRNLAGNIKGLVLQSTAVIQGGQGGTTTVTTLPQSVSGTPLALSVFTVPAGYTQTPPGTSPAPGMMGGFGGN